MDSLKSLLQPRPKARPAHITTSTNGKTPGGLDTWTSVTNSTSSGENIETSSRVYTGGHNHITKTEMGPGASASGFTSYADYKSETARGTEHTREYVAMNEETGHCQGHLRTQDASSVSNEAYDQEHCAERFEAMKSNWMAASQ